MKYGNPTTSIRFCITIFFFTDQVLPNIAQESSENLIVMSCTSDIKILYIKLYLDYSTYHPSKCREYVSGILQWSSPFTCHSNYCYRCGLCPQLGIIFYFRYRPGINIKLDNTFRIIDDDTEYKSLQNVGILFGLSHEKSG